MPRPRYVTIEGRKLLWKDVVTAYREEAKKLTQPEQPALFELREDHRPAGERTAAERYTSPSLFSTLEPS